MIIKVDDIDIRCPNCNKKFFRIKKMFGIIEIEIKCGRCGKLIKFAEPQPTIIEIASPERQVQTALEH